MPTEHDLTENRLNCLYYPFSRLLDPSTLKYLLLIFDSISFVDEARDLTWRRNLLKEMQPTSRVFEAFEGLVDEYGLLEDAGIFRVIRPDELTIPNSDMVAMSVLADLEDRKLVEIASHPARFGLPSKPSQSCASAQPDRPTWQIFQGKIPRALQETGWPTSEAAWEPHVLRRGDSQQAWSLSYEAGSVCTVNYYLEAAQELKLTPITTSSLHHQLVLRKLKRTIASSQQAASVLDDEVAARCRAALGHGEIIRLLGGVFPVEALHGVSVAEILRFRRETAAQRQSFMSEVSDTIRILEGDPTSADYDRAVALAVRDLQQRMLAVRSDLSAARDKLLPSLAEGTLYGAAGSGALGSLATFLGGLSTAGLVAASALTIGGALGSKAAQWWAERRQVLRRQSGAVAYLLALDRFGRQHQ